MWVPEIRKSMIYLSRLRMTRNSAVVNISNPTPCTIINPNATNAYVVLFWSKMCLSQPPRKWRTRKKYANTKTAYTPSSTRNDVNDALFLERLAMQFLRPPLPAYSSRLLKTRTRFPHTCDHACLPRRRRLHCVGRSMGELRRTDRKSVV